MDEDVSRLSFVAALRRAGMDVLTVADVARLGLSDTDQLEYSTRERRVLVSGNSKDFYRIHTEWVAHGKSHAGIFLITQNAFPIGACVRAMQVIWQTREAESLRDQVHFLQIKVPCDE